MRQRLCRLCREWHDIEQWPAECMSVPAQAQSDVLAIPYFISDNIDPIQHPIDGKFYSSKSTFSKITRDAGAIEVGNDPARLRPKQPTKVDPKDYRASIEKAKSRYIRGERV